MILQPKDDLHHSLLADFPSLAKKHERVPAPQDDPSFSVQPRTWCFTRSLKRENGGRAYLESMFILYLARKHRTAPDMIHELVPSVATQRHSLVHVIVPTYLEFTSQLAHVSEVKSGPDCWYAWVELRFGPLLTDMVSFALQFIQEKYPHHMTLLMLTDEVEEMFVEQDIALEELADVNTAHGAFFDIVGDVPPGLAGADVPHPVQPVAAPALFSTTAEQTTPNSLQPKDRANPVMCDSTNNSLSTRSTPLGQPSGDDTTAENIPLAPVPFPSQASEMSPLEWKPQHVLRPSGRRPRSPSPSRRSRSSSPFSRHHEHGEDLKSPRSDHQDDAYRSASDWDRPSSRRRVEDDDDDRHWRPRGGGRHGAGRGDRHKRR